MSTITGVVGPTLGQFRGNVSAATLVEGEFVHAVHPELSLSFFLQVGKDGRIVGHYGGRVTGQQIRGFLQDGRNCQMRVGGYLMGETILLDQDGNHIDGKMKGHVRATKIHYILEGSRLLGSLGSGLREHAVDVEVDCLPPLLVAGLAAVACHHFVSYPNYLDL